MKSQTKAAWWTLYYALWTLFYTVLYFIFGVKGLINYFDGHYGRSACQLIITVLCGFGARNCGQALDKHVPRVKR